VERRERRKDFIFIFYDYNIDWVSYSASQCIGKHCSFHREQKIIGKQLWVDFCDFHKIFPKI
jgi:hypothetical protein